MKINHLILASCMTLMSAACGKPGPKAFLPGQYVSSEKGELSQADDTLEIKAMEGNNFLLSRNTGYNLIREGKLGKREYHREVWNAVFDEGNGMLLEIRRGKIITVFPDSGFIRIGKRKYIKK